MKRALGKIFLISLTVSLFDLWAAPIQPISTAPDTLETLAQKSAKAETCAFDYIKPTNSDINSEALGIGSVESIDESDDMIQKSSKIDPNEANATKELYLTFDDGPLRGTGNVLKILQEEGVAATMFCVARHAKHHRKLLQQEYSMPNLLVANHTYSHANGRYRHFYSHTFELLSDIEHAQLVLGGRKYLRLAGRNVWRTPEIKRDDLAIVALRGRVEVPQYDSIAKEGFHIYGWDTEWHFHHRNHKPIESAQRLAKKIERLYKNKRLAKPGKVILLAHDFMFKSKKAADQLRRFIRIMKENGWSFYTIKHYSQYRPQPLYVAKYYGQKPKAYHTKLENTSCKVKRKKVARHRKRKVYKRYAQNRRKKRRIHLAHSY